MLGNAVAAGIDEDLLVRIDGSSSSWTEAVAALDALCDRAEDAGRPDQAVVLDVSGAPAGDWTKDLTVAVVSKWERALRRLEKLSAFTLAVADGDCGGMALEALLATDYRLGTRSTRLLVPVGGGATWPGMVLHRLAHQVGPARVRHAALFGAPVVAEEALDWHVLDELADDKGEALATAASRVRGFSGTELAIRRRLLLEATTTPFEDALGPHLAACDRALRRAAAGRVT